MDHIESTDIPAQYDNAVANRDPQGLMQIAQNNPGTPEADHAFGAATTIVDSSNKFQKLTSQIDANGGAATPEGRIKTAEAYKTVADNPQWGTALIRYVLGDKQGAVNQITGGDVKTLITYDNGGNQIVERINALGEPVSRIDAKTGKPVDQNEYAQRVGGISAWANTQAGKRAEQMGTANAAALVKNTEAENKWATVTAGNAGLVKQFDFAVSQLKDVNPAAYAEVLKYGNRNLSSAASSSNSKSLLNSWNNNVTNTEGQEINKSFISGLGLQGIWYADGKGGITDKKGHSATRGSLEQQQNTNNAGLQNETQLKQDQANLMMWLKANPSSKDPQENARIQNLAIEALRTSNEIAKNQSKVASQYETPSFLTLPSAFAETDQHSRGQVLTQQHLYNEEVMKLYQRYYNSVIKNYPADRPPAPQEIESNFIKQQEFKDLQQKYFDKTKDILNQKIQIQPEAKSTKPVSPPAKAANVVPKSKAPPKKTARELAIEHGGAK
jgi:hypothetical protein